MTELSDQQQIGDHLKELFEEEVWEAGTRLARALAAEEEGLPELAAALRAVAEDEARHAYLIGRVACPDQIPDARESLARAISADRDAAQREERYARLAVSAGMQDAERLFERLERDEQEHVQRLETALQRAAAPAAEGSHS